MKFRYFLILSFLIHLIVVFLLFLIPDKEREKQENPPIFVDLIEPKAPPAPPKVPRPTPQAKPLKKPPAKKPEPPKPILPVRPTKEDKSVVPEKLEGGLTKKTTEKEKDKKQPVPKPKKAKAKKPVPKAAEKPKKRAAAKKTPPPPKPQPQKRTRPTKKTSKPVTQAKKKPVPKKPDQPKKTRQDFKMSKSDKQTRRAAILKEKPKPTGDTPAYEKSKETAFPDNRQGGSKKGPVNLFDREILQKHASQDYASAKSYDKSSPSDRGKSSDHGVVTLDTTDIRYAGYMSKLKQRIEYIWKYPTSAVHSGLHGDLYIRFTILQNGSLSNVEMVRTSGHQVLDKAAVQALKDGAPYWPFPKAWGKKSISITGHFIYSLGGRYGVY